MPNMEIESQTLSGLWVFYESLKDDNGGKFAFLRDQAKAGINAATDTNARMPSIISNLYKMSGIEAKKELDFLQKYFKGDLNVRFNREGNLQYDDTIIRQIIDAFNSILNLEKVYNRNKKKIKANDAIITIAKLYPYYFNKAWEALENKLLKRIQDQMRKNNDIKKTISKFVEEVAEDGVKRMFLSSDRTNDETQSYLELISAIGTMKNKNSIVKKIYDIYKLDDLTKSLQETIKSSSDLTKKKKKIEMENYIDGLASKGGLTNEVLSQLVGETIMKTLDVIPELKTSYGVLNIGDLGAKTDNIFAFNVNLNKLDDALYTRTRNTRLRNIHLMNKLEDKLKQVDKGYIIHSNVKNYTLGKNFSGFKTGDSMSLLKYRQVMNQTSKKSETLIGTIMNTIPGSVGGPELLAPLSTMIASDISYFLFDDVKSIGELPSGSVSMLHIFDLDGIYIPLSIFLFILAKSFEQAVKESTKYVTVQIKTPSKIMFDEPPYGMERWKEQKEDALNNITISIKFFKSFKDFINQYLNS